jgi:hypothetical protein
MTEKKTRHLTEEEFTEATTYQFNEGRQNADNKWTKAIDERIAELEKQVGIPELRRLREKTRYRWDEDNDTRMKGIRRR